MELRKFVNAFVLVIILLCSFAIGSTQGVKRREKMLFGNGFSETNEEFAELACIHCRKALIDRKGCFEGFDFYLPQEATTNSKSTYICEAICVLPSFLKQEFLDCLWKNKLIFVVSAQGDSSTSWVTKCSGLLFVSQSDGRRFLAGKSHGQIAQGHAPYLVPELASTSPFYIPAPSNSEPTHSPSSNPLPNPLFQKRLLQKREMNNSTRHSPRRTTREHSPPGSHARSYKSPQASNDKTKIIFIAVAATAATTFCFFAALFCCFLYCMQRRNNKVGPRIGQRDDSPLLHLSDLSPCSSPHSSGSNSYFKEHSPNSKMTSPLRSNLSMKNGNYDPWLVEITSPIFSAGAFSPLKPPPGRLVPPPGRPVPPPPVPSPPVPPTPGPSPPVPPPPGPSPLGPLPSPPPGLCPPPPPPKVARGPPAPAPPPPKAKLKPSPPGPHCRNDNGFSSSGSSKAKLKPFFWDKVVASPGQSVVWHEISSGSFQFDEEMIESLFGYNAVDKGKSDSKRNSSEPSIQYIQIIDPRKAQNLSILLRALDVTTEEVVNALRNGTELPAELLQTLLRMAPTSDEELKLRLFTGDISQLGPAEHFLKILVDIPFAFKRMESLVFMSSLQEEISILKESFAALEVASDKLRNSRLFLKLLEAVLKTGNRMNDGTYRGGARAFKLDTLLKLSDVKGTDGKTTLLHFVIQEIIRSEGKRALRSIKASQSTCSLKSEDLVEDTNQSSEHYRNLGLKVISGLSNELEDVKNAAAVDADVLTSTVSKLKQSLTKAKAFLNSEMKTSGEDSEFHVALATFVDHASSQISWLSEEEKRIMARVQSTADYFHGNAGKNEGLHLFTVVRDFLIVLDKACKDVRDDTATELRKSKETPEVSDSPENCQQSDNGRQQLFPTITGRQIDYSSSDDESPSA